MEAFDFSGITVQASFFEIGLPVSDDKWESELM